MQNLNLNVTELILSYLTFEDALCLRLLSKLFRDKIIPQLLQKLFIMNPNEELVNALKDTPSKVINHYQVFCHLSTFRFSNLIIDKSFLSVFLL